MTDSIKEKLKEAEYSTMKNAFYAGSLQFIDKTCAELKEKIPGFSPYSLAIKLTEMAEKEAERQAARALEHKEEIWNVIEQEIATQAQAKMAV